MYIRMGFILKMFVHRVNFTGVNVYTRIVVVK